MVHLMRGDGFQCIEAGNGIEALEQLEKYPVTLVLSDLRMPKMDGFELLREIRARFPDVAVVMITAVADVEIAVNCLAIGAADYVIKPYQLEDVRARVAQAIEKRRLILENRAYRESLEERVAAAGAPARGAVSRQRAVARRSARAQGSVHARPLGAREPLLRRRSRAPMGLDGEVLRQIELGGHVHDIGKIGVRESVLNKAGRLTPEEYEHIMTHPVLGWRILAPLLGDTPSALNIVRSHHERFDGRGVPDGLKGIEIPLEARIVCAADALDAMTSDRPYRPSEMSLEMASKSCDGASARSSIPTVVDALVAAAERGELQLHSASRPRTPSRREFRVLESSRRLLVGAQALGAPALDGVLASRCP